MKVEPFQLERWQSLHEHAVEINLSDSGVHPLCLKELLTEAGAVEQLLDQRLIYTQTNGTEALREAIAALYPGAGVDQVQAVNGGAEANFLVSWALLEPGDEVVVMVPNYMQVWGLAGGFGARRIPWRLEPDFSDRVWRPDMDRLADQVGPRTKLIALCNPNNPTGARMTADCLDEVCRIADRNGAWVLADEIYQGSELDGATTASAWGRGERVIVTNSLSKSYGLPGLRLGWIVAPESLTRETWARHDYTTIAPTALSDGLAQRALAPKQREQLLDRARVHLRDNYARVQTWLRAVKPDVEHIAPEAGAMLFMKHSLPDSSEQLADRLRKEHRLLVVPGAHYDMDRWLRVGFGGEGPELEAGLSRLARVLTTTS